MKLQLLSEDVEAALADGSSRALQRIPAAVQEVSRIKVGVSDVGVDKRLQNSAARQVGEAVTLVNL